MAWPDSADAIISTATTQTANIDTFIDDVLDSADSTLVKDVDVRAYDYIDDPDWVDPLDGSRPPQIVNTYQVTITFTSRGIFSAAAGEKVVEVKTALGI